MIKFFVVLLASIFALPLIASPIRDQHAIERLAVSIKDLQIFHQEQWRNLSVELSYSSKNDSFLTQDVHSFIRNYLEAYSEPMDFWEVMNRHLVEELLKTFPAICQVESKLSLAPDASLIFPRASIVEYEEGVFKESFAFTKLNWKICNQSFEAVDLYVRFQMKENPAPTDFPDYQWISEAMEQFFADKPISFSVWEEIQPELEAFLLQRFPSLIDINVSACIAKS